MHIVKRDEQNRWLYKPEDISARGAVFLVIKQVLALIIVGLMILTGHMLVVRSPGRAKTSSVPAAHFDRNTSGGHTMDHKSADRPPLSDTPTRRDPPGHS